MRQMTGRTQANQPVMGTMAGRSSTGRYTSTVDASRRAFTNRPRTDAKWPRAVRIAFIIGASALLWGALYLAVRML